MSKRPMLTKQQARRKRCPKRRFRNFIDNAYGFRNAVLKRLGFESYDEYLSSPLWQGIRLAVLRRFRKCYVCQAKATEVHHAAYTKENLSGEDRSGLFSLCSECHHSIEWKTEGGGRESKRMFSQAVDAFRSVCLIHGQRPFIPNQPRSVYRYEKSDPPTQPPAKNVKRPWHAEYVMPWRIPKGVSLEYIRSKEYRDAVAVPRKKQDGDS